MSPTAAYSICKRLLDIGIAGAVLLIGSPLWIAIAVLIKITSTGPVFYKTLVVGEGEGEFQLLKFRSMLPGSDGPLHREAVEKNFLSGEAPAVDRDGNPIFKTALMDGNRITTIGRWLRKTSLDEVPQCWNVLKGEMSMVGPRPSLPFEARLYDDVQRARFRVPPGITGLYQVTKRNRVGIEEMVRIDLQYVQQRSVWLDLMIMLRTPIAMLRGM